MAVLNHACQAGPHVLLQVKRSALVNLDLSGNQVPASSMDYQKIGIHKALAASQASTGCTWTEASLL